MSVKYIYDFEKPLQDIQLQIDQLKSTSTNTGLDVTLRINDLEELLKNESAKIYSNLTRWQKVQLARHPDRPHSVDHIKNITNYWFELHGDRNFSNDKSIISGHYIFSKPEFIELKKEIEFLVKKHRSINLDIYLKKEVKKNILRYLTNFNLI